MREFWVYKTVKQELVACEYQSEEPGPFTGFTRVREVNSNLDQAIEGVVAALEVYSMTNETFPEYGDAASKALSVYRAAKGDL